MGSSMIIGARLSGAISSGMPIFVDAVIKGVVLLALVGLAMPLLRRASASTRHLVWFAALAALPLLPLLSAALPGWQVLPSWLAVPGDDAEVAAATMREAPVARRAMIPPLPPAIARGGAPPTRPAPPVATQTPQVPQPRPTRTVTDRAVEPARPAQSAPWQVWALTAWLAGTLVSLLPIGLGWLSLRWLRRKADEITDGPWPAQMKRLADGMGVRRRVILLRSDRRSMPMQWGILRPKLLLPAEAGDWTDQRRRVVVLHELAHIKRCDCLTQLIAQVTCALYWFNPLVWIALRRIRLEREAACDDLILAAGCRPSDYAEQLLQIASGLQAHSLAACGAIAMARPSALEGRLLAILDAKRNRQTLTRAGVIAAAGMLASAVFALAMIRAVPASNATAAANGPLANGPLANGPAALRPGPEPVARPAPDQQQAIDTLQELGARIELRTRPASDPPVSDVVLVHLEKRQVSDGDLRCLADLVRLERLYLADTRTTDDGLEHIAGLSALRRLSLHGTKVTDAGLAHLARLSNLEVLDVHSTRITDAGLVHLHGLTKLKFLNLSRNKGITDRGLAELRTLGSLRELDLTQTSITNAGVAQLREMAGLSIVKLAGTQITPGWLGHLLGSNVQRLDEPIPGDRLVLLKQLPQLKHVKLRDVTDAQLALLGELTLLERLDLTDTEITDTGLARLETLANLRSLVLRGTAITDAGLIHLRQLTKLESLDLSSTHVSDAGLRELRGHPTLQWIIAANTNVSDPEALPGVRIDLVD